MEFDIHVKVLLSAFIVATVLGAVMAKTNFCTMGAVSDWVNMGSLGRMRSWLLAVAVAAAGLLLLELMALVRLPDTTMPPYRTPQFAWLRYLLGGFLFGIGMTLASGCGTKTLIRLGGGNLKSVVVAAAIGAVGYAMFTTDLFNVAVMSWLAPTIVDLTPYGVKGQNVDAILGHAVGADPRLARAIVAALVAGGLAWFVLRSADVPRHPRAAHRRDRGRRSRWSLGWLLTGGPAGEDWRAHAMFATQRPEPRRGAVADLHHTDRRHAPLLARAGAVQPAQLWRDDGVRRDPWIVPVLGGDAPLPYLEWFASWQDFVSHLAAGLLMGFGGFLAMGCTIGQGVSGASTLALGSFMALASMIAGAAVTMKIQYRLVD
jgi:uncharacterized protein